MTFTRFGDNPCCNDIHKPLTFVCVCVCVYVCMYACMFSHETVMVQVGLQVPTPLAVSKGLFSCKFFACTANSACLVHRHPGFARCYDGLPSGSKRIHMYACM